MVAKQEQRLGWEMLQVRQALDDASRVRTAIDQVAQKDDRGGLDRAITNVILDLPEKIVKQIEPSVNVADRIEPLGRAVRQSCARPRYWPTHDETDSRPRQPLTPKRTRPARRPVRYAI